MFTSGISHSRHRIPKPKEVMANMNVVYVGRPIPRGAALSTTRKPTVVKNHITVALVGSRSSTKAVWLCTIAFTLERGHLGVMTVAVDLLNAVC